MEENDQSNLDKATRHAALKRIIDETKPKQSIGKFILELAKVGITTSRPTVSRDLKEMNYQKKDDGKYTLSEDSDEDNSIRKHSDFIYDYTTRITSPVNSIAIRTKPGIARGVEVSLKKVFGKRIFGTLAGDNMVILILNSESDHDSIRNELKELTGLDFK